MEEIKIKVGTNVIYRNGLKGEVTKAVPYDKFSNGLIIAEVLCENGYILHISKFQEKSNFPDFYRIGSVVLGNKSTEMEIQECIQDCDSRIEKIKQEKDQLRKQLWRLREEMVDEWKDKNKANANKNKNQSTEEDTED
jgi:hypothetical protein